MYIFKYIFFMWYQIGDRNKWKRKDGITNLPKRRIQQRIAVRVKPDTVQYNGSSNWKDHGTPVWQTGNENPYGM